MRTIIVTYQLHQHYSNHNQSSMARAVAVKKFRAEIMKNSHECWHYVDFVWFVVTEESAHDLWGRLAKITKPMERVLVAEVNVSNECGSVPFEALTWFSEHKYPQEGKSCHDE